MACAGHCALREAMMGCSRKGQNFGGPDAAQPGPLNYQQGRTPDGHKYQEIRNYVGQGSMLQTPLDRN